MRALSPHWMRASKFGARSILTWLPSLGGGAAQVAKRDDLHKPLSEAVFERLREQPVGHWLSVVRCKMPEILSPPPYALY